MFIAGQVSGYKQPGFSITGGTGGGGFDFTPPLDDFSNSTGGWSMSRNTRTGHEGSHALLRRADNETTTIEYVNGRFDTAGVQTWIGAQSAFVHTLYNPTAGGNDAIQTVAANQPRIALNGVIDTLNGEASMYFDGVNDFLNCDEINGGTKPLNFSTFAVFSYDEVNASRALYGASESGNFTGYTVFRNNSDGKIFSWHSDGFSYAFTTTTSAPLSALTQTIQSQVYTAGDSSIDHYINDGSVLAVTISSTGTANGGPESKFSIGRQGEFNGVYFKGHIQEVLTFNVDNESNRTGIRDNLNSFYTVYP